ncbi:hypothetical protein C8J57DRAFT_1508437 [Mycena rebaudengoi]|nr:hypothetical protein C8J57DRAFT_1508437 [Mycena rebaudengoi]
MLRVAGPTRPTGSGRRDISCAIRLVDVIRVGVPQTHNVADGTGGMGASIRFTEEPTRPEACDTFQNTPTHLLPTADRYVSIAADMLALATVMVVDNWKVYESHAECPLSTTATG